MDVKTGFFYLFSVVLLFSAFRVVTARNPVHAVLFLMLAFSQASAVWLLLGAEFLAIVLVLVYLGAVMVLFLFVVMMLDIRIDQMRAGFWKHGPLAAGVGALVVVEMVAVLMTGFHKPDVNIAADPAITSGLSNTAALGTLLYTKYLYPVEIAAVILLVGIITAIALTLRERKDTKRTDPSAQVRVRAADRMTIVKVNATQKAVAPAPLGTAVEEKKA